MKMPCKSAPTYKYVDVLGFAENYRSESGSVCGSGVYHNFDDEYITEEYPDGLTGETRYVTENGEYLVRHVEKLEGPTRLSAVFGFPDDDLVELAETRRVVVYDAYFATSRVNNQQFLYVSAADPVSRKNIENLVDSVDLVLKLADSDDDRMTSLDWRVVADVSEHDDQPDWREVVVRYYTPAGKEQQDGEPQG